jgi:hypothetical protein
VILGLLQIVGAVLVFGALYAVQSGRIEGRSRTFNGLNLAGSALLLFTAVLALQPGFILLNGAWALSSARAICRGGT